METDLDLDKEGNLLTDGRWVYTFNAENQLTEMETRDVAYNQGVPRTKLTFAYDYQGRRFEKKVYTYSSGFVLDTHIRYVYDGWNLIAELDVLNSNAFIRRYFWGLDLSGTLGGAGGAGGLTAMVDSSTGSDVRYLPQYDGNGNLIGWTDSSNATEATFEYSPFGEMLAARYTDAAAADVFGGSGFRHGTQYYDAETGLYYYGYRYYSPDLGRFINRDPIGFNGGMNLYGFVGNNPVDNVDWRGLSYISITGNFIHSNNGAPPGGNRNNNDGTRHGAGGAGGPNTRHGAGGAGGPNTPPINKNGGNGNGSSSSGNRYDSVFIGSSVVSEDVWNEIKLTFAAGDAQFTLASSNSPDHYKDTTIYNYWADFEYEFYSETLTEFSLEYGDYLGSTKQGQNAQYHIYYRSAEMSSVKTSNTQVAGLPDGGGGSKLYAFPNETPSGEFLFHGENGLQRGYDKKITGSEIYTTSTFEPDFNHYVRYKRPQMKMLQAMDSLGGGVAGNFVTSLAALDTFIGEIYYQPGTRTLSHYQITNYTYRVKGSPSTWFFKEKGMDSSFLGTSTTRGYRFFHLPTQRAEFFKSQYGGLPDWIIPNSGGSGYDLFGSGHPNDHVR